MQEPHQSVNHQQTAAPNEIEALEKRSTVEPVLNGTVLSGHPVLSRVSYQSPEILSP